MRIHVFRSVVVVNPLLQIPLSRMPTPCHCISRIRKWGQCFILFAFVDLPLCAEILLHPPSSPPNVCSSTFDSSASIRHVGWTLHLHDAPENTEADSSRKYVSQDGLVPMPKVSYSDVVISQWITVDLYYACLLVVHIPLPVSTCCWVWW